MELPLRLLRHYASSVRRQQYHDSAEWGTCREGHHTATYRCAVRWPEASACRAPPGELPRGRRSKPSPRFFAISVTPSRPAARGGAGVNTGVPWPARHSAGWGTCREGGPHRHLPMRRALAGGQRVPAGGRRSKPSPRFFAGGVTTSRQAARGGAGRRSAFHAVPALLRGWRYALSPRCAGRCRSEDRRSRAGASSGLPASRGDWGREYAKSGLAARLRCLRHPW